MSIENWKVSELEDKTYYDEAYEYEIEDSHYFARLKRRNGFWNITLWHKANAKLNLRPEFEDAFVEPDINKAKETAEKRIKAWLARKIDTLQNLLDSL